MTKTGVMVLILAVLLSGCQAWPFNRVGGGTPAPSATAQPTGRSSQVAVTPSGGQAAAGLGSITPVPTVVLDPARYRIRAAATPVLYPFRVQPGSPRLLPNFANSTQACNWMGIAGQVYEIGGPALTNIVIAVQGTLAGATVDKLGLTGLAVAYGPGGYEIQLSTQVLNSTGTLKIQAFDLNGNPLTEPVAFNTVADCQKNLIVMNFQRQINPYRYYFPVIGR